MQREKLCRERHDVRQVVYVHLSVREALCANAEEVGDAHVRVITDDPGENLCDTGIKHDARMCSPSLVVARKSTFGRVPAVLLSYVESRLLH